MHPVMRVILVHVFALPITVFAAGPVIARILRPFDPPSHEKDAQTEKVSALVGQLERFLIYMFVFSNGVPAIGALITAKSVFRIWEIRDGDSAKLGTYILVGTLTSFSFATFISLITKWIVSQIA
jgi:hypothetical protein